MTIFDGKAFAKEIEERVKTRVADMVKKPKIVSIVVGDDPASALYTRLKKAAAERVGIQFEVVELEITNNQSSIIKQKITEIGARDDVTGVMVQLPLPEQLRGSTPKCLEAIPLSKDVDGLRWEESGVKPATVRAVMNILGEIAERKSGLWNKKFVVVGARGAVGRPLVHFLRERGVVVDEVEWDTPEPTRRVLAGEVVISCVGKAGLVMGEMVRDEVVAIDVGMSSVKPQSSGLRERIVGDMTPEVYQKASVAVPVPGGVGPVTIASLTLNALDMV